MQYAELTRKDTLKDFTFHTNCCSQGPVSTSNKYIVGERAVQRFHGPPISAISLEVGFPLRSYCFPFAIAGGSYHSRQPATSSDVGKHWQPGLPQFHEGTIPRIFWIFL
ncbi:uncharacterized protein LOC116252819 isoform X2 [Nymphaea colorata]|uniref:uncharacterized protein LOC116252819 isoform X2 n=1 Tax=Nymphaea colorata TaxID=210225 RepID=UPI00214E20AF|nr:uncharacterized protein LOC116252819 isoform X2 [Nymphaea colorata]